MQDLIAVILLAGFLFVRLRLGKFLDGVSE
jgi:hypothetical protein